MNANLIASFLGAVICFAAWSYGWYMIGFRAGQNHEIQRDIEHNRQFNEWMSRRGIK